MSSPLLDGHMPKMMLRLSVQCLAGLLTCRLSCVRGWGSSHPAVAYQILVSLPKVCCLLPETGDSYLDLVSLAKSLSVTDLANALCPVNPASGASRWFLEYCKWIYIHYPGLCLCDSDKSLMRFRACFTSMTKVPLDTRNWGGFQHKYPQTLFINVVFKTK